MADAGLIWQKYIEMTYPKSTQLIIQHSDGRGHPSTAVKRTNP